ncbi:MAG: Glutamate--tRNA ligase [Pedosphaera sp.]|nr:Glutamate--tRNA ligase [Pedosphaera sp.]
MTAQSTVPESPYRGRIAPSPTGFLHLGHASTFWIAQERTRSHNGTLILRSEDLDTSRVKAEFVSATLEDLRWFGIQWQEGPDCGGVFGPYSQSERRDFYLAAFEKLRADGLIYPCACSRKDILNAAGAPHEGDDEPIYPGTCRPGISAKLSQTGIPAAALVPPPTLNWRFRVPDGESISFLDGNFGRQEFTAGKDFGDFVVWQRDKVPAYQLAVVVDDHAMQITEVVRGEDLLKSTARQLLLYRALGLRPPSFFHCHLVKDASGMRLAKRHDALSLRELRKQGMSPDAIRRTWPEF